MPGSQLAFTDARGGMNAFDPPHKIATNQVARMVNCSIVDGFPTTRLGGRVVPFTGPSREVIAGAPIQGSLFYNPAKGQGGIVLSESNPCLAVVVAGRKFLVSLKGRKGRATSEPREITEGLYGNPQLHLAWISQWEDLLIVADGIGKTFIYQPEDGASLSNGYNTVEKDKSQIPNGATCLAYVHGRGVAVVNSRQMLVGDSLHRTNFTSSLNLREFTEQVYWATGQFFLPPSAMGGINALAILPLKNTQHGHGDLMAHCEDGLFSVDLTKYPRSEWSQTPMVKHALLQAGATGPYAVSIVDGDQIYRTRKGAQSLRSAAATAALEGNPEQTLSPEVDTWFSGDYPRWLRFASVCMWDTQRRIFFTTAPVVQGTYRWHRGMISRNADVALTSETTPAVWEGLWTLPPQMRGIIQIVNGLFDGEERQFAWTRGVDDVNRLVEFCPSFRTDILPDGTAQPIRCQVITRAIDGGEWWKRREYTAAKLYIRNIAGLVRWGVWFRGAESPVWIFLRAGSVELKPNEDPFDLTAAPERAVAIMLGKLPEHCLCDTHTRSHETRSIQFLVRWEGYCSLEGVKVETGETDLSDTQFDVKKFTLSFSKAEGCHYDDYEYSQTNDPVWIEKP